MQGKPEQEFARVRDVDQSRAPQWGRTHGEGPVLSLPDECPRGGQIGLSRGFELCSQGRNYRTTQTAFLIFVERCPQGFVPRHERRPGFVPEILIQKVLGLYRTFDSA